jgi:hypothetical protein
MAESLSMTSDGLPRLPNEKMRALFKKLALLG